MNKLLMIFIIFVVSAASFEGFFVKWSFRDCEIPTSVYSFQAMYDGTAERPFVGRQLMMTVSKSVTHALPNNVRMCLKNKIEEDNFLAEKFCQVDIKDNFIIEYYTLYFLSFLCLFASVFIWRQLCADVTGNLTAGTLGALTFTILFPYLETTGGYYYDCSELLFFSLATLLAYRGHYIFLILLSPIAAYNKESFFFFLITLYPLLRLNLPVKKSILTVGVSVLLAGLVHVYMNMLFANNPGGQVQFNFLGNLIGIAPILYFVVVYRFLRRRYILYPIFIIIFFAVIHYLKMQPFTQSFEVQFLLSIYNSFGHTYSVISGEYAFFLHIIMILWLVKSSWQYLDDVWKLQAKIALLVNAPLVILFGLICELRNWSILYPTFVLMISFYIKNLILRERR